MGRSSQPYRVYPMAKYTALIAILCLVSSGCRLLCRPVCSTPSASLVSQQPSSFAGATQLAPNVRSVPQLVFPVDPVTPGWPGGSVWPGPQLVAPQQTLAQEPNVATRAEVERLQQGLQQLETNVGNLELQVGRNTAAINNLP